MSDQADGKARRQALRPAGLPRPPKRVAPWGVLAGLAASLALASVCGCAKGTYLEVRFTGPAALDIQAIRVELTLSPPGGGAAQHSIDTVRPGGRITLPTAMAFKLDDDSGDLQVKATALGAANLPLASDMMSTTIMHGQTWTINLRFAVTAAFEDTDDGPPPVTDGAGDGG